MHKELRNDNSNMFFVFIEHWYQLFCLQIVLFRVYPNTLCLVRQWLQTLFTDSITEYSLTIMNNNNHRNILTYLQQFKTINC